MNSLYRGYSLTQSYASVIGRYQVMDQNIKALRFQTSFDKIKKKPVLKTSSAEGGSPDSFFFADPDSG
jgi:hypothetical protein